MNLTVEIVDHYMVVGLSYVYAREHICVYAYVSYVMRVDARIIYLCVCTYVKKHDFTYTLGNIFVTDADNYFYYYILNCQCTDKKKHAEYKAKLQKAQERGDKKEKIKDAQLDAQTVATWQFLGAKTDQLWLLVSANTKRLGWM